MTQLDTHTVAYTAFVIAATLEVYFFMMQRSALEIGRKAGISARESRRMLPLWFVLHWPNWITKWASVIYIAKEHHWLSACILLAFTFLFQLIVPIPHQQFIPLFRRKVAAELASGELPQLHARLYAALNDAPLGKAK